MTAPDTLTAIIADLPTVTEWHPLPDDRATVIDCGTGEWVVIHNYYGPTEPRALVCEKHGIQRHDWNGKRFVCKVCTTRRAREKG